MSRILFTITATLLSTTALAHHPLAGRPMETFAHGLLSGVGHPLLGFDHLFFVALVGVAATFTAYKRLAPLAYIVAMLVGCLVVLSWPAPAVTELMVALSLLVLGSMLLSGHRFRSLTLLVTFAGFGLFHGAAFGSALAGQEAGYAVPVMTGYLLGLGITQYMLALITGLLCTLLWNAPQAAAVQPRLAGAMVAGAGLYLSLEHFEGPLLRFISG